MCLLCNSLGVGGAEEVVKTLSVSLQGRGLEVSVLCLEPPAESIADGIDVDCLAPKSERKGGIGKLRELKPLAKKLKKYIESNDIGLVQSHIYRANYVNVTARKLGSSHSIQVVNHGMPSQYQKEGLKGWVNRRLISRTYPVADQVICPSQAMIRELEELGVPANNLRYIPNPLDTENIMAMAQEPSSLTGDYFLAIGRLVSLKRFNDIISAFGRLAATHGGLKLVLLGAGPEQASIEAEIKAQGLEERVKMIAHTDNPFSLMAGARALVSASESEGFSLVIAYALLLGTPVVSSNCPGGPKEILTGGEHGQLFPVGDVTSMVECLERVLSADPSVQEMVVTGRQRAEAYRLASVTEQHLESMQSLGGA